MQQTIIVEILVAVLGFIGSLTGAAAASKLTNYRLEQLEKKVDRHNDQLEKLGRIEHRLEILEAQVSRIEEIK